ncbi:DNA polymerase epsilon subunit 4 [Nilaparvata lugens]|uniref:DNA polymerase epsilon subunit 4 n=1 Tax=Nilaparvata lugens TaxID=108931 RepID=UPI00193E77E5|nr:DNA polymerase epsilon subunit 4 [Nilaparvata lugens]
MEANIENKDINNVKDPLEENEEIINSDNSNVQENVEESNIIENDNPENDQEKEIDDDELDSKKPAEDVDSKVVRPTRLPISRIKSIMKFDEELNAASQEAVFIITKATELFIEELSKETYQFTLANKKKTLQKKDVENAFWSQEHFTFLDGCFNE